MRRFISVWLPHWPTDRWRRQRNNAASETPLALIQRTSGGIRLTAVDALAAANGLTPGMRLADARALVPELINGDADPAGDQEALGKLCDWCSRFTPWAATDGDDGLILDVSGVPHLFGGEAAMLDMMQQRFAQLGCDARLVMADTPAAAWAWAHHGTGMVLPPGSGLDRLAPLPVEALRLANDIVEDLKRLGLRSIANLAQLPRAPLTRRFGPSIVERLDRLQGKAEEPISPQQPPALWRARASLAEPIVTRDAIDTVLRHLLDALCKLLEQHQRGARQLSLHAYRVDGDVQSLRIGTSRASRDAPHLFRLYRDLLDGIDPGFGIDLMLLEASATEPLAASQREMPAEGEAGGGIAECIDRLQAKLGRNAVFRLQAVESHWPERAIHAAPLYASPGIMKSKAALRPVALLPYPQMLETEPDRSGWPEAIHWHRRRRRLVRMEGPERITPEWWSDSSGEAMRDYYAAEDAEGRRYWLFRSREAWFLHGLFA